MRSIVACGICVTASLMFPNGAAAGALTPQVGVAGPSKLTLAGTDSNNNLPITAATAVPPDDPTGLPVAVIQFAGAQTTAETAPTCWQTAPTVVACRAQGIKSIAISLGDGDDAIPKLLPKLRYKIDGGGDSDRLVGGQKNDMLKGGAGTDQLTGNAGDDKLAGGSGDDQVFGDLASGYGTVSPKPKPAGNDKLSGGSGIDSMAGGAGRDAVSAGGGDDDVGANEDGDKDKLDGGPGNDHLGNPDGKALSDRFKFDDKIKGFESLALDGQNYPDLESYR